MIESVSSYSLNAQRASFKGVKNRAAQSPISNNAVNFTGAANAVQNQSAVSNQSLVSAYQAMHGIKMASSVNFSGSLAYIFDTLRKQMVTCEDLDNDKKGEQVGSRVNVSHLIDRFGDDLVKYDDAVKTTIPVKVDVQKGTDSATIIPARTQLKKVDDGDVLYEMVVRDPVKVQYSRYLETGYLPAPWTDKPAQNIKIQLTPGKGDHSKESTLEKAYVLETKGNLMAVVEDGDTVLLTNAGTIYKKDKTDGTLTIEAEQKGNVFTPFVAGTQEVREREKAPSIGTGTDIVIGMEDGRFVGELIKSIEDFQKKVENGEVLLDPFVEAEGADKVQLAMLAGGFGSRAEYTNASSKGIFHGEKGGAQSTKGVFQTATGLTPMETTFITLHKAGLLDCSNLKVGGNVKFYLNKSGVNKGNGGFTVDLYNKMEREGRDSLFILPNDSMSRMTNAVKGALDIMNSGKASIAMISKKVQSKDAEGALGIMKLGDNNEILEFAEKPKTIPAGYADDKDMCLTNTFQFMVSKESFQALAEIEPHLYAGKGKETRDWSKLYVPILMALTQKDDPEEIQEYIYTLTQEKNDKTGKVEGKNVPLDVIKTAQNIVKGQKVYSVPTDEPWADCGTLNALYHTTMQIASGDFPLEDFERAHVLQCVNTKTGLVASTPEQKEEIYQKYYIKGQVMAVKQAEKVDTNAYLKKYKDHIVVNEKVA